MDNINNPNFQLAANATNTSQIVNIINTFMGSLIVAIILVIIFIVLWILLHPHKN